jgi:hypothetical protein
MLHFIPQMASDTLSSQSEFFLVALFLSLDWIADEIAPHGHQGSEASRLQQTASP